MKVSNHDTIYENPRPFQPKIFGVILTLFPLSETEKG